MALEAIIRGAINQLDFDGRAGTPTACTTMDVLYRGLHMEQQDARDGAALSRSLSGCLHKAGQAQQRPDAPRQPDHCLWAAIASCGQLQQRERSKSEQACYGGAELCGSPRLQQWSKQLAAGMSPFSLQQQPQQQQQDRLAERPLSRCSWPSLLRLTASGGSLQQQVPSSANSSMSSSQSCGMGMPCCSPSSHTSSSMAPFCSSSFYSSDGPASMCVTHSNASTISSMAVSESSCWSNRTHHISSRAAPGGPLGDGIDWVIPEFGGREVLAEYEFGQKLGCGTFGVTRLVTHRKTARPWACKTICKASIAASPAAQSDVQHEVAILQHLSGDRGIVQLQGVYEDERNIHLVMELCTGGDLLDYISRFGRLPESEVADIAGVMLSTLQHCHALGVVHRDIKPENFLLGAPTPLVPPPGSAAAALKMSDFGVSAFHNPGESFSEIVGTPFYMAPEVIMRCYGPPADIWSVGVVIYLMIAGCLPFNGNTDRQIIKAVMDSEPDFESGVWGCVSPACKSFLRSMLCKDPAQRASIQQLLSHPWLAGSRSSSPAVSALQPQPQQQAPVLAPVAVAAASRGSSQASSPNCSPRSSSGGGCGFYSSSSGLGRCSCPGSLGAASSPRSPRSSRLVMMSQPGSGVSRSGSSGGGCGSRSHTPPPAACRLGSRSSRGGCGSIGSH